MEIRLTLQSQKDNQAEYFSCCQWQKSKETFISKLEPSHSLVTYEQIINSVSMTAVILIGGYAVKMSGRICCLSNNAQKNFFCSVHPSSLITPKATF